MPTIYTYKFGDSYTYLVPAWPGWVLTSDLFLLHVFMCTYMGCLETVEWNIGPGMIFDVQNAWLPDYPSLVVPNHFPNEKVKALSRALRSFT